MTRFSYRGLCGMIINVCQRNTGDVRIIQADSKRGAQIPYFTREQYAGFIRQEFERLKAAGEIQYNESRASE